MADVIERLQRFDVKIAIARETELRARGIAVPFCRVGQADLAQAADDFHRYRRLPNGDTALPIDQPESSPVRADFYRRLVNKDLNEINAYWSRLIFSGRTSPPLQASSAADVMVWLLGQPGGVAYVDRTQVDKRLRIVMEFPR